MKKIVKLMGVLLITCGLAGCFQVDHVVTLLPDGSGTVEETCMISRKIAESMAALTADLSETTEGDSIGKSKKVEENFFKDAEIKKRAENFGPDVRLVTMERIATAQFEGYKAVYAFKDINKLRVDQGNPGMQKQMGAGSESSSKGIEFLFTPGKTATLVVKQQKKDAGPSGGGPVPEAEPPAKQANAEELAMMRQMFDGLRFSTILIIKGNIMETNATHRTGSTITLAEIDFGKILDKPEMLVKMAAIPPADQAAAMEMLKTFPGMKIDLNDELRVRFK